MATTEILPFATAIDADVQSQADFAAATSTSKGFSNGIAEPDQLNKVWRQSSFIAAGIANWLAGQGVNVPDDGDLTTLVANLTTTIISAPILIEGDGATKVGVTPDGTGAVVTDVATMINRGHKNLWNFLTTAQIDDAIAGTTTTDLTSRILAWYAHCAENKYIGDAPAGKYRFTTAIPFNQRVDLFGDYQDKTIFLKDGNIDGIIISAAASNSQFHNFMLDAINDVAGRGIVVTGVGTSSGKIARVYVQNQAGHGWEFAPTGPSGFYTAIDDCSAAHCGGDGLKYTQNMYRSKLRNFNSLGNTGWGVNILVGNDYNDGDVTCQQNTAGGIQIDSLTNNIAVYGEVNVGPDIQLGVNSTRNLITVEAIGSYPDDIVDLNTTGLNTFISISGSEGFFAQTFSRIRRTTNDPGLDAIFGGGAAGSGAAPKKGGSGILTGGDSHGTGDINGGKAIVEGGAATGTGLTGVVQIQPVAGAGVVFGSAAEAADNSSVGVQFDGVTQVMMLHRLTTTQRNALTPLKGMIIYNTTTDKLNFYSAGTGTWQAVTSV